jgi:lipopolysaccharide export system protein LptA
MRWQQTLRIGIAAFGVSFLVFLFFAMRPSKPRDEGTQKIERVDRTAAAESTSGEIRRFGVSVEHFRVEYEKAFTYPDGRQKLTGAQVFIDKRAGRNFKVSAKEADVAPSQDDVKMRGNVELTASDGMLAKTEEASYSQKEGIIRAPGPATFSRARLSGSSVGLTYDETRDVLWLLDQAVVKMAPETPGAPGVDITAGAAGFARADHYVRYDRGFKLVTGPRVLTSDLATTYLDGEGEKVQTLEMRGHGKVAGAGEGAGALRLMEAEAINLEFAADGRTMKGATLATDAPGRASVDLGTPDAGNRRVSGHWIDIRFAEDGSTVSSLTVRDQVQLEVPGTATEPARTISSATLLAGGEQGKSLNAAKFSENVEYRENRPNAAARIVRARLLDLVTQPGLGAIDSAHFTGAVRYEEDTTKAAAGDVRYFVSRGVVNLDGIDDTTDLIPRVSDGQVTIDGKQIEMVLDKNKITAKQDVRSVMVPASDQGAGTAKNKPRRAGMLKQDQPVYAMSAVLNYDSASRLAVYESVAPALARLWQGETTIVGQTITVDDSTGNLTAKGKVASTLMLEQRNDETNEIEQVPSVASSTDLLYEDALRRATYTGGAHVAGPQGDLRALRIELFLKEGGSELEKVEGYDAVSMKESARVASGDRLTFFNDEGRYVMVGMPVRIVADCRETTGRTLTFFKATNNIMVDPTDELRTLTRPVPGCIAPDKKK